MTTTTPVKPVGRIMLLDVRLSFPALFKPDAFKPGDEEKYKGTFLVPKDSPQIKAIEAAILAVLTERFPKPGEAAKKLAAIRNNPNKFCWQDGEGKYDGWDGTMALSAKAKISARPTVVDNVTDPATGKPAILTEAHGRPYPGCYVNASIDFFVYDSSGIGVSAQLRGVQFVRDGDAFSAGRPASADEFEEVTEGASADEFA